MNKVRSVKFCSSIRMQNGKETNFLTSDEAKIEFIQDWCVVTEKDGRSTATPKTNVNWIYFDAEEIGVRKPDARPAAKK